MWTVDSVYHVINKWTLHYAKHETKYLWHWHHSNFLFIFFLYFDWKSWTLKTHFIRPKYPHIINFLLCTCVHKFEFISNRFLGSHLSFFVRRYIRSSYWNLFISEKSEFITFWVKKKEKTNRVWLSARFH